MNIKLHTPKSLKAGSGLSTVKQFVLSLIATSISIALTFGTAAIIDYQAKQKAKREIVMMVMYDMYTSLKLVEKADSSIQRAMDIQLSIAQDTTKYDKLRYFLATNAPRLDYTETTERIFSSSIESINTVGNVLFTQNVADFYQSRQQYKTMVCDSIYAELLRTPVLHSMNELLDFEYLYYGVVSVEILHDMKHLFAECKQMMDVSDEDLEAYREQREQIKKNVPEDEKALEQEKQRIIEKGKEIIKVRKGEK
jgi:ABC-type dipeptide/oligopeptide/nickel transport system ATPase subunit